MKKIAMVFIWVSLCFACKDEFNLPEDNTIEDNESPVIAINSPIKNNTYTGTSSIPIIVDFTDNYEIEEIQFQLSPVNYASPSFSVTKKVNAKTFRLDTVYTIPAKDSIVYDVLIIVNDLANNITSESYQFTTKD